MHQDIIFLASFAFIIVLFWKTTKITPLILLHTFIIGIFIAIACATNDLKEAYSDTHDFVSAAEFDTHQFNYMRVIAQYFTLPLLVIWNYQYWFIGKERERLFSRF